MPNPWIVHVKKVQAEHGITYKEALKEAKKTYVKKQPQQGEGVLDDISGFVTKTGKSIIKAERRAVKSVSKIPGKIISGIQSEALHLLKSRPNKLKKFMHSPRGKMKIINVEVYRTPVEHAIQTALNLISKNKFKKEQQKKSYDDMYHLYMVMTFEDGKEVAIEKNEVLKITRKPETRAGSECKSASVPQPMVFNEMMSKAEEIHPNIYRYTAWKYNCQDFIFTLLTVLGISQTEPQLKDFVLQDFTGAFKGNKHLKTLAVSATDVAALGKRLLFGAGNNKEQQRIMRLTRKKS